MKKACLAILLLLCAVLKGEDRISVIIPCHAKHFIYIPNLLKELACQTLTPDEVVMSVSEADQIEGELLDRVEKGSYPFDLKIAATDQVKYAGENRNIACLHATGDIIIAQDADDLPHPQRIEILAHILTHTDAVHVLHRWYPEEENSFPIDFEWIDHYDDFDSIPIVHVRNIYALCRRFGFVHNGNIAIRREVLERLSWNETGPSEDVIFNRRVISWFKRSYFLEAPLVIYRPHLSAYH